MLFITNRVLRQSSLTRQGRSVAGAPRLKRINILAHSMGNRVLRGAIRRWSDKLLGQGPSLLFRHLSLVATDLENESLTFSIRFGTIVPGPMPATGSRSSRRSGDARDSRTSAPWSEGKTHLQGFTASRLGTLGIASCPSSSTVSKNSPASSS
jgi:hypothetical protein